MLALMNLQDNYYYNNKKNKDGSDYDKWSWQEKKTAFLVFFSLQMILICL